MWNRSSVLVVAALIVGTYVLEGAPIQCDNVDDQNSCNTNCRRQGFEFGKCDYSKCACYGHSESVTRGNRVEPTFSTTLRTSTSETTTPKRRAIFCSSNWTGSFKIRRGHDTCREFCHKRQNNVYAAFDTLCCCQKY